MDKTAKKTYIRWQNYCKPLENDQFTVQCNLCSKDIKDRLIKRTGFNTKQIHAHLWKFHNYKHEPPVKAVTSSQLSLKKH